MNVCGSQTNHQDIAGMVCDLEALDAAAVAVHGRTLSVTAPID